jgi:DNA-binding protein YbaB
MDESPVTPDPALGELRASATSDDGLVTATVDGTGRLVDLAFEPTAMRKPSADLAALTCATVAAAQDAGRDHAGARLAGLRTSLPSQEQLTATLQQLQATATSKLAEMSATLEQLLHRNPGGSP